MCIPELNETYLTPGVCTISISRMRPILGLVGVPESNEAYLRPMEEEPPVGHLLSPAHVPRVLPQQLHLR